MARNSKFSKNTLFYQVFHSPEFSDYQEAFYPSRMIRSLLQIYPLRASRWLLGLDTTVLVDTLNCLSDRIR